MPFLGTKVIPAAWSRHHVPTAAAGMNARCVIDEQTGSEYDPAADTTVPTWTVHYDGPCRVQSLNQNADQVSVGQDFSGRAYLFQLDMDAAVLAPGLRVRVTECDNDPALMARELWTVYYDHGSERFTRDVTVSDSQADAQVTS